MILRRVIDHVRHQQWTAIGIDFVIVVVGVIVGLQVSNWNTEREIRRLEQQYLARLHDEITGMIDSARPSVEGAQATFRLVNEVLGNFADDGKDGDLTAGHCDAITRSHIYAGEIVNPPTIEELLGTGRILVISDHRLRTAIVDYAQSIAGILQLNKDIQIDRLTLSRRYPDLISLGPKARRGSQCLFSAMRQRRDFMNDLVDNSYRLEAYAQDVMLEQQKLRMTLHRLLDRRLGVTHAAKPRLKA